MDYGTINIELTASSDGIAPYETFIPTDDLNLILGFLAFLTSMEQVSVIINNNIYNINSNCCNKNV